MTPSTGRFIRQVFISSVSEGFEAFRNIAHETIERLEQFPSAMEQFGARSQDAITISVQTVAECDVFIGIVAWRYGTIKAGQTRSISHLEYDEAINCGKSCFIFLADPSTESDTDLFPTQYRDIEHVEQLYQFRSELKDKHIVGYFNTPDDLGLKIATSLHRYLMDEFAKELGQSIPRIIDLPTRAAGFVGREIELSAVIGQLLKGQSLGLAAAVTGMGGIGKSALASEALYRISIDSTTYQGDISWVHCTDQIGNLGSIWVYDQILAIWGKSLSPEELARRKSVIQELDLREIAIRTRLRFKRPVILLLDNIEPNFPTSPVINRLKAVGITVLVTSRKELSSPHLSLIKLDVLDTDPSVQLFQERVISKGGSWEEAVDKAATIQVVEALGRLPLAIELAAARTARTKVAIEELSNELQQPGILEKLKDVSEPNYNVRYILGTTLALLTFVQRVRFASLSLPEVTDVPLSIILTIFESIPPDPLQKSTADEDLELLTSLSLVNIVSASGNSERRVRIHTLLRELAAEEWYKQSDKIRIAGTISLLQGVLAFINLNKQNFALIGQEETLLIGSLRRSTDLKESFGLINSIVGALWNYCYNGGHWHLGIELNNLNLAISRDTDDINGGAAALNRLGILAYAQGKNEEAIVFHEQALTLCRTIGNQLGEASNLSCLGVIATSDGKYEEARSYYEQALELQQINAYRKGEGATLQSLGTLMSSTGQIDDANQMYNEALKIRREIGDRIGEGQTLHSMGILEAEQRKYGTAIRYYDEALKIRREVGDRTGESVTLYYLGILEMDRGRTVEATVYFEQALSIEEDVADRVGEELTLKHLGRLSAFEGNIQKAQEYYARSFVLQEQTFASHQEQREQTIETIQGDAVSLNNLGLEAKNQGEYDKAKKFYNLALLIRRNIGDRAGEAVSLNNLGVLEKRLGHLWEARKFYQRALTIVKAENDKVGEFITLSNLGLLAVAEGNFEDAIRYFRLALINCRERADKDDLAETLAHINQLAVESDNQYRLGMRAQMSGNFETAINLLKQALFIDNAIGDKRREILTLYQLAMISKRTFRFEDAIRYLGQSFAISRETTDFTSQKIILVELGKIAEDVNDFNSAIFFFQAVLKIAHLRQSKQEINLIKKRISLLESKKRDVLVHTPVIRLLQETKQTTFTTDETRN